MRQAHNERAYTDASDLGSIADLSILFISRHDRRHS